MLNNGSIRIAICDDHPVIRYGLTHIINNEPDIEVAIEAPTSEFLVSNFSEVNPDITILDLELNDTSGIECLRELRQSHPATKVIIYTAHGEYDRIMDAIDLGIQGYLLKQSDCSDIINSIRVVYNGGTCLEPDIATKLLARMRDRDEQKAIENVLSKREIQVLNLLALGKTNRDIANSLYISERTVKFHVSSILEKLQVRNRTEAALYANQHQYDLTQNVQLAR